MKTEFPSIGLSDRSATLLAYTAELPETEGGLFPGGLPLGRRSRLGSRERVGVYSKVREDAASPRDALPPSVQALLDRPNRAEGIEFLSRLPDACTSLVFFDPEYRGVMEYQSYGNEGQRQKGRAALAQMAEATIRSFLTEISRILAPRGHLMLWVDKFHLVEGTKSWLADLDLQAVDLVTWDKGRMGMGYRTRRRCEYLVIAQKRPLRAKGVWTAHDIPDVWTEKLPRPGGSVHAHAKPTGLQAALIAATTAPGDVVVDPAAGSFSVMHAAHSKGRHFLGCDLEGEFERGEEHGKDLGSQ
jgi:site-specific DNA-methyltransferase (adenine-specific)